MHKKNLRNFQNLSIDIVLGAVIMSWLFAAANNVRLPLFLYLILGFSVWLVYTFDHLVDAKKIKHRAQTDRHKFHFKHFQKLQIAWLVIFTTTLLLALSYLTVQTWLWGSFVLFFIALHFVLVHFFGTTRSRLVLKEVGVAWGYAAGVVIGPWSLMETYSWPQLISFLFLFIIAFFNLTLFSFFEFQSDQRQGQSSIAINYGKSTTRLILNSTFAISLTLGIALLTSGSDNPYFYILNGYLLFISIVYYSMFSLSHHLNGANLYRLLGDGVFLAPLILLVFT